MIETIDYPKYLNQRMQSEGPKRKGERTRDRLKIATAELLNRTTYQELRITDICKQAKIAPGTFYLYFDNKLPLTIEILSEFVELWFSSAHQLKGSDQRGKDSFDSIFRTNLAYIQVVRANPGLFRCVLEMSNIEPEFASFLQRTSAAVYDKGVTAFSQKEGVSPTEKLRFSIHALGSMIDDTLRRLIVMKDPYLIACVESMDLSDEDLARALSTLWYRGLFGHDPEG